MSDQNDKKTPTTCIRVPADLAARIKVLAQAAADRPSVTGLAAHLLERAVSADEMFTREGESLNDAVARVIQIGYATRASSETVAQAVLDLILSLPDEPHSDAPEKAE